MHRKTTSSAAQRLSRLVLAWNSWPIVGLLLKGSTRLDGIIASRSTNQAALCRGAQGSRGVSWNSKRLGTISLTLLFLYTVCTEYSLTQVDFLGVIPTESCSWVDQVVLTVRGNDASE
jgi:hypothetical protein